MATNPDEEARRIVEEGRQDFDANVRSLNSATQTAATNMGSAARDIAQANREVSKSIAEAEAGFRSLGQSAVRFSRALTSSDDSMSKYNSAIDAAGAGLAFLATAAFGPLGIVLGIAVKAFTALVGAQLSQTDRIITNFNKLGELGAAAQFTTSELEGMFNEAGFSTFNGKSELMVKAITSLGADLTKLGATSGEGIKTFTQLASFNSDILADQQKTRNQFANLGFSQEKLLNAQASFMKEQGALGFGRKQVDTKLVNQSLDYTKNLSMLSALTGESTDAVKASRQKDLEDFGFNVALRQLGDSEAAKKQRDLVQNMSTMIGANVDPTAQAAFRNMFANGVATSQEAIALQTRTGGQMVHWVNDFRDGKLKPEEFLNKLNESGDEALKSWGAALKASGELRDMTGFATKTVENTAKSFAKGAFDATRKEIDEKTKNIDPYVGFANSIKNATDSLAKMMDSLLKLIQPLVMDAFQYLIKAIHELTLGFMNSKFAKDMGMDFSGLSLLTESDEKLKESQRDYVKALELKENELKEKKEGILPRVNVGRVNLGFMEFRSLEEEIKDLKNKIAGYDKELNKRDLNPIPVIPSTPAGQNKQHPTPPKGPAPKPPAANNTNVNVAPQFKFGGVTGEGFSNFSNKITGSGIFDGPSSGYRKTLPKNKNFAVVPLPSGDTIPVTFKNEMMDATMPADLTGNKSEFSNSSSQLSDMITEMINIFKQGNEEQSNTTTMFSTSNNNRRSTVSLESITNKLDTLLDRIRLNNNLQTELLDHARG